MKSDGRKRVIIENIWPQINEGTFPIKRVTGEEVVVEADVFADGHDEIAAVLAYTSDRLDDWREVPMQPLGNDRWQARFCIEEMCRYYYTVWGWIDHFKSWQTALIKKSEAGRDISMDIQTGITLIREAVGKASKSDAAFLKEIVDSLTKEKEAPAAVSIAADRELSAVMNRYVDKSLATRYHKEFAVSVDRDRARFSSWYELFPRSCGHGDHGTFADFEEMLPVIANMGFDIVYLPPIHPIGKTNRKGKNNATTCHPGDPGSPWAIGSDEGGHKAVHPALGTLYDFKHFVNKAHELGLEVALDIAFQCSPDHPYVREHPEWFKKRPDGTIQHAENPPKIYEDIVPFDFECGNWEALWHELRSVIEFWLDTGVRIFRIDNPHTKSFPFWEWLISAMRQEHPDVLFLAEAFTRPKIMQRLAKLGFSQSYTYFTWRNTKYELTQYMMELTQGPMREYFRPNFWPNTPDILPEFLQYGGRPAFILRLALAATLSSNYGIYGPAYELCINSAMPEKEEYADSEKYEIKQWDRERPDSLTDLITRINRIRKENPALQTTLNIRFHHTDNDVLLFFSKRTSDGSNTILVIVNLDPFHTQSGWITLPVHEFDITAGETYLVHDLIADDKYVWQGERNYVELNPAILPVHIFRLHRRLRKETDFDYYM